MSTLTNTRNPYRHSFELVITKGLNFKFQLYQIYFRTNNRTGWKYRWSVAVRLLGWVSGVWAGQSQEYSNGASRCQRRQPAAAGTPPDDFTITSSVSIGVVYLATAYYGSIHTPCVACDIRYNGYVNIRFYLIITILNILNKFATLTKIAN